MLLAIDKIVLTEYIKNITKWSVYITISNLSYEIKRLWSRSEKMIVGLIPIDKRDFLEVKIEIYHQTIRIIIKKIFKSLFLYIVV